LRQHYDLLNSNQSIIQDRSVYEDAEIFARNLYNQGDMSTRDWACYYELYETLSTLLKPPHLVIYLQASVATLRSRIAQRGRDYEQNIPAEYLAKLNTLYEAWITSFTLSPVLTINTDHLNYVEYDEHLALIWQKIEGRLQGRDYLALS
jgi:deoxyadenosine/deoxycytidine kinase